MSTTISIYVQRPIWFPCFTLVSYYTTVSYFSNANMLSINLLTPPMKESMAEVLNLWFTDQWWSTTICLQARPNIYLIFIYKYTNRENSLKKFHFNYWKVIRW